MDDFVKRASKTEKDSMQWIDEYRVHSHMINKSFFNMMRKVVKNNFMNYDNEEIEFNKKANNLFSML